MRSVFFPAASQFRTWLNLLLMNRTKLVSVCFVAARNFMRQQVLDDAAVAAQILLFFAGSCLDKSQTECSQSLLLSPPSLPLSWCCSLHRRPPHLFEVDKVEESLVSFFSPPFSLLPKSVWVVFWRHHSLFFLDTACTGDDFRDAHLLEKNFWEESECRLAACSRPLPSPGLVKLPCSLINRHSLD